MQSMKSQQVTEEDILQEFLNEYYSEENFKREIKGKSGYQGNQGFQG